jgi:hypothetical protein
VIPSGDRVDSAHFLVVPEVSNKWLRTDSSNSL